MLSQCNTEFYMYKVSSPNNKILIDFWLLMLTKELVF